LGEKLGCGLEEGEPLKLRSIKTGSFAPTLLDGGKSKRGWGMRVLLIDNNPEMVNALTLTLKTPWHEANIACADNETKGIEAVKADYPDIVMLNIDLPGLAAFVILKRIREFSDVPIIILTTKDSELDKVRCLEGGADDYIVKPFSTLDFLARVNVVLRRAGRLNPDREDRHPLIAGDLTINLGTREVSLSGRSVHLTPTEYKLLYLLVGSGGRVVSHEALRQKVWGTAEYVDPGTLRRHIVQLRKKLGDTGRTPRLVLNERAVGYRFVK